MATPKKVPPNRTIRWLLALMLRLVLAVARPRRRRSRGRDKKGDGVRVLMTGTYYSTNWIDSQLQPLSQVPTVESVMFVGTRDIVERPKIRYARVPRPLQRVFGEVPARLMYFFYVGLRERPDVVGGYHLLLNGLAALVLSRFTRSQAIHVCVGGLTEVLGGGYATDNRLFRRLQAPDIGLELKLIEAIGRFDGVVVRGQETKTFFANRHPDLTLHIITAGIDAERFSPSPDEKDIDIIFAARLTAVKRITLFLQVVEELKKRGRTTISAAILGDGRDKDMAEEYARRHDLERNVVFVGHVEDVVPYFRRARVFVLTSQSEGLSQAMIQAMLCGLPAVVSDVGSLGDLVKTGRNGYLVIDHVSAGEYADGIQRLLESDTEWARFSERARKDALTCSVPAVAGQWTRLFEDLMVARRAER